MKRYVVFVATVLAALLSAVALRAATHQLENLGRGIIAVRTGSSTVYVGWRLLGNDPSGVAFNVYRGATKVNASPLTATTDLVDSGANLTVANTYTVRAVVNGVEGPASAGYPLAANPPTQQYISVPLQIPPGGTTPDGVNYTYSANDCSVADLDGDGEYEIIVKWDPSNSKDNSQSGYTGNVYIDAYKLNGTRLWRIDLGRNIRAGAHYTQFMVYDLDGDGKAEIVCKTADATISGTGQVIGNGSADWRNTSGYILTGPEFQTVFNGMTGAILSTVNYNPPRGVVGDWGDTYGNRVDRFINAVAYVDGVRPSVIMGRGYYTRLVRVAWDWRNGAFTQRWMFDSNTSGNGSYAGQGNHQLSVGDINGDGLDDICNGASAISGTGAGLYANGLGHGDALHMTKLDTTLSGLQVWQCHESPTQYGNFGEEFRNNVGTPVWGYTGTGGDIGRCCAGDIDPNHAGAEVWGPRGGVFDNKGNLLTSTVPPVNFMVWWDADLLREFLDGTTISKWDYTNHVANSIFAPTGVASNNGSKANPALSADLFGDWREEVIWRATDSSELRIYTTTIPSTTRLTTLMHDRQYRLAIAWQNSAYNQPPHPSFYLGTGMTTPAAPKAYYLNAAGGLYPAENGAIAGSGTVYESTNAGFYGTGYVNFGATGGSLTYSNVNGGSGGSKTVVIRFALGATTARTGTIVVNGSSQPITFNPTGAWTTWVTQNVTVTLNAGANNTIVFNSTGTDLANIDEITIQ